MRLLAALECPQASAGSSVDSVLASVGDVQTYEEACDGECCVGSVCGDFTIRVCRDSTSCSGEGACRDVSIYDVFLGCEGTEVCYYAGNKGSGAWVSCVPKTHPGPSLSSAPSYANTPSLGRLLAPRPISSRRRCRTGR